MLKTILVVAMSLASVGLYAQKTNIGYVFPTGAQRGTSVELEIGGQNLTGVASVVVSGEGVKAEVIPPSKALKQAAMKARKEKRVITDEDNMQLAQKVRVRLTIDPDARIGIRDLRVLNGAGVASNRLFFEIGQYPDSRESEPNDSWQSANAIVQTPAVINGQVMRGERDYFSFDAAEGTIVVAEVKAQRFVPFLADAVPGWFQPVLTMYDSKGIEVAFCDDYALCPDPVIIYKVPRSGRYILEINDAIYRGREDFVYRIAVGEIPFVTSVFPRGARAGSSVKLELEGVNLGNDAKSTIETVVKIPKDAEAKFITDYVNGVGFHSNDFMLRIGHDKETVVTETNSAKMTEATMLSEGEVVNSRIDVSGDEDWYAIDAQKGESWIFEVVARRVGSPLDAHMTIVNSKGVVVATKDDVEDKSEGMQTHHADPEMIQRFTQSGRYYIRIADTQNNGGSAYSYRLRAFKAEPDFSLRIEPSSLSIPQGGTAVFTVFALRKYNFRGEIRVDLEGLPKGYRVSNNIIQKGEQSLKMTITSPSSAPLGRVNFSVVGTAVSPSGSSISHEALPVEAMMQAFYITHLIPTDEFRVDIAEPQPFTIHVDDKPVVLEANSTVDVKIRIDRREGFNEPVQIMLRNAPRGIKITSFTVEPGHSEAIMKVECQFWKQPSQKIPLIVLGTVKASTQNRVQGQARNTVNAAVMVISHAVTAITPSSKPILPTSKSQK